MERIIIHWTGGGWFPNATDKEHYHFLIDKNGKTINGKYKVEDNENCTDGKYAAHCGGGNTGSIGISMCGMYGFKNSKNVGAYPLTKTQCEACFKLVAQLCKKHLINVNNVITHYEFGLAHPKTSSNGKIDIIFLPPYPEVDKKKIGVFIRNKVKWYLERG